MKLQSTALDVVYLHHWAQQLGVVELLTRALREAGVKQD
jgi:hypothetical protein